jgi:hypothetical protein
MGWAAGDTDKVARLKVQVAQTRQAAYPLIRACKDISDEEKGPVLTKLAEELYEQLNKIDLQLNR